jgi:hypothetical protein
VLSGAAKRPFSAAAVNAAAFNLEKDDQVSAVQHSRLVVKFERHNRTTIAPLRTFVEEKTFRLTLRSRV